MGESKKTNVIKRIDMEPTDEILIKLMKYDPIDRNEDLKAFISMLDSVEGGYSFFIDGKWGDGKTFFCQASDSIVGTFKPKVEKKGRCS